ncbi:pyruvate kinase [Paenibacillus harenae]|uniref:Pyruvate kinase n=1 Tax=Paenibacillus harenae TaxID=306543 RepID=A0ABT9TX23_PAEHA|nr:pyruvate kinase [Paenibacillus harenae]MDQ0061415.1 pyruvate kinase [Paenibacillus harenae]MDQ0110714.1 pyruvate kinase [Paenibacillus harenae]
MRKTKIVCTMGPSCQSGEVMKEMIKAGMNVARLNMAHGELEDHSQRIKTIRAAAEETGSVVSVMMDIKGPEVRIGKLQGDSYELVKGNMLTLTTEEILGTAERISVNYSELPLVVSIGGKILLDDGLIELEIASVEGTEIVCTIINGGVIKPRKGVNLPGVHTTLPGVTERDIVHINFGIEQGVDMIAASFVRKAEDIYEIKKILEESNASHIQVLSKIENEEGVINLDAIIEASDGIMVARGDLGVEIPVEDVPLIQREMIEKSNRAGKPVIVATQMLDSMQVNPRPTRAEVSDVASAVLQGTDAIMLSGETAAGKYPIESVLKMASIAERAESIFDYASHFQKQAERQATSITEVISQAAVSSSRELGAKAIIAPTESGFTARMVSKYRPEAPIMAIATDEKTLHKLSLVWGVIPVKGDRPASTDELFQSSLAKGRQGGLLESGDYAVIAAGVPIGKTGATNLIKIVQAD